MDKVNYFKVFILLIQSMLFIQQDSFASSVSDELRSSIIWSPRESEKVVAFRKTFNIVDVPLSSSLHIFADSKYMLWINGKYVARGPCRFDPKRPEYDTLEVSPYLKPNENTIAVLVYGHVSGGDSMEHNPGLTIMMDVNQTHLTTDLSWKVSSETRFKAPKVDWDGIREVVRADLEQKDWIIPSFDDGKWEAPVIQDKNKWGMFISRTTTLLSEKEVPYTLEGRQLPLELTTDQDLVLHLTKNIMGYCVFRFDADTGSRFSVFGHQYTARAGEQEYITADIFGSGATAIYAKDLEDNPNMVGILVHVDSGRIKFKDIRVVNAVAPLVQVGEFKSSDALLNRFFKVMLNMHTQITQDTYTDGASEGNEWVADVFNISQFTKVAFAGKNSDGSLNYADRRHLKKALLDFAISQQPDGRVKAHHPSDRFDLHWFIEDFAALWVMSNRNYFEMTKDASILDDTWTPIKKQMEWFKSKVTAKGLIQGREWMTFDNPYAYKVGEGATMNAIVYKAFLDASYLATLMGDFVTAADYAAFASQMKIAFNVNFWNRGEETFNGMIEGEPSTHVAVMSLFTGIVSDEHRASVSEWLLHRTQKKIIYPLVHLFWFKDLYEMNNDQADQQVLSIIRSQYGNKWNALNAGFLTSEGCKSGRNFHNFGMVPGYYMSAYILGVRTQGPAWEKKVLIEPRLGDLEFASGIVSTENGPVTVSWDRGTAPSENKKELKFSVKVPATVTARIGVPFHGQPKDLVVNGEKVIENGVAKSNLVRITPRFIYLENLTAPEYTGILTAY